jgi:hypothetical protein
MKRFGKSPVWIAAFALLCVSVAQPVSAQTLSLVEPHAGASVVAGVAEPGSAPIIDPPLIAGDTILAEDAQGRQSPPVTVLEPSGPAAAPAPE